ncbi:Msa1 [Acrasis kona]|uniref:Msa1 n=1 Tax=Acrasis kona TaxID=1008807 RepID=A0AAW2ZLW7_9EUKA
MPYKHACSSNKIIRDDIAQVYMIGRLKNKDNRRKALGYLRMNVLDGTSSKITKIKSNQTTFAVCSDAKWQAAMDEEFKGSRFANFRVLKKYNIPVLNDNYIDAVINNEGLLPFDGYEFVDGK